MTPPLPARPPRPVTVSVAIGAVWGLAVILVFNGVLAVLVNDTARRAQAQYDAAHPSHQSTPGGSPFITLAIDTALALVFAGLGLGLARGSQIARIGTWVFAGLGVCCGGNLALSAKGALTGYLPHALIVYDVLAGALVLVFTVCAIVLLALRPSHPYFRRPDPLDGMEGDVL